MTTTQTTLTEVPVPEGFVPLSDYLDNSGDAEVFGMLVDELVQVQSGLFDPDKAIAMATRRAANSWESFGPNGAMPDHECLVESYASGAWLVAAITDQALADRVLATVPAVDLALLRTDYAEAAFNEAHPFFFEVGGRQDYRCALTGERHHGHAVRMYARGDYGDALAQVSGEPVTFNPEALMTHLADILGQARVSTPQEVCLSQLGQV